MYISKYTSGIRIENSSHHLFRWVWICLDNFGEPTTWPMASMILEKPSISWLRSRCIGIMFWRHVHCFCDPTRFFLLLDLVLSTPTVGQKPNSSVSSRNWCLPYLTMLIFQGLFAVMTAASRLDRPTICQVVVWVLELSGILRARALFKAFWPGKEGLVFARQYCKCVRTSHLYTNMIRMYIYIYVFIFIYIYIYI